MFAIIFLYPLVPGEQFVLFNFKREQQLIKLMRIKEKKKKYFKGFLTYEKKNLILVLMQN